MALFVVSYDLNKTKNYQPLWDEMERLGGHKPVESVYLLSLTTDSTEAVRDHLQGFVDDDDYLIVVKFTEKPRFVKAKAGTKDWINRHF
ncbi:hypothetical protein LDO31_03100 [Luteimonas sp. XNQY3]|nr:hypothetical protein [Luteimonas sp. XNQY3]MCD9005235.1 hypothetical protein [Luteimonas sp. XNQY3]